jgi:hypothetical protein
MSTIREQILVAIEAVLATASVDVHPDWESVEKDVESGIIFGAFLDTSSSNNMIDKHSLAMPMGFFGRGENARSAADAIQNEVFQLLHADPSFGSLVKRLIPGPVQGGNEATGGHGVLLSQTYTAEFFTEAGSQTAPA